MNNMNGLQIGSDDSVQEVLGKTTIARKWLDCASDKNNTGKTELTLRISAHIPGSSPAVKDVFEPAFKRLEIMTNGAIKVVGHWGGSLHKEREGIEALNNGLTDMCPVYSAWDDKAFPAAQTLSLPFIFPSAEVATAVSEALYQKYFRADFERQGVLMGRMVATSEYNLFSKDPIKSLEDIAGKKIACSNGVESDVFSALGAMPIGCSTPEAKEQFESGAVFAMSISDSAAHTVGIYKSAKFRTSANLVRVNLEYGLSRNFVHRLTPELKPIFNQWLRSLAQAGAQLFYGLAGAKAREVFRHSGMQFISLSSAEQLRWKQKVGSVESSLIERLEKENYPAKEMVSAIRSQTQKYESWSADQLMQETIDRPFTDLLP
jgi:TRAP-type C4-dicarboxylate transport system substrate-binding protein